MMTVLEVTLEVSLRVEPVLAARDLARELLVIVRLYMACARIRCQEER